MELRPKIESNKWDNPYMVRKLRAMVCRRPTRLSGFKRTLRTKESQRMSFKIKYRQTCRICGIPMEAGTTVGQDAMGMFHAKGCEPAKYEPVGTKRRPGDGGKRPTNSPGGTLYGPQAGPEV